MTNIKTMISNKEKIEKSLIDLLVDKPVEDEGLVIEISGEWGVGKTYFWEEFRDKKLKDKKEVAYISLFGHNSLEEIKEAIIADIASIIDHKKLQEFKEKTKKLKVFNIEVGGLISFFSRNEFENIIICFDDFERLSQSIELKDVLGLIAQLKEQKKCKIIMILNENELHKISHITEKKDDEVFTLYKEKIVDYHFPFNPSFEDQFEIIKKDIDKYFNSEWSAWISDFFEKAKIYNIRKMKYILRQLEHFVFVENHTLGEITYCSTNINHGIENHKNLKGTKLDKKVIKEFVEIALTALADKKIDVSNYSVNSKEIINVIVEFEKTYHIDNYKLLSFLSCNHVHKYRYEVREEIVKNIKDIDFNFQIDTEKVLQDTAELINKHSDEVQQILSYYTFKNLIKQFNNFSITIRNKDKVIKQYIEQLYSNRIDSSHDDSKILDEIFSDYSWAEKYWDSLKAQFKNPKDDDIISILDRNCYEYEDEHVDYYLQLNNIPVEKFMDLILNSPEFVNAFLSYKNREYIREDQCEPPTKLEIGIKRIEEALDTIEIRNKYDKWKIDSIKKCIVK